MNKLAPMGGRPRSSTDWMYRARRNQPRRRGWVRPSRLSSRRGGTTRTDRPRGSHRAGGRVGRASLVRACVGLGVGDAVLGAYGLPPATIRCLIPTIWAALHQRRRVSIPMNRPPGGAAYSREAQERQDLAVGRKQDGDRRRFLSELAPDLLSAATRPSGPGSTPGVPRRLSIAEPALCTGELAAQFRRGWCQPTTSNCSDWPRGRAERNALVRAALDRDRDQICFRIKEEASAGCFGRHPRTATAAWSTPRSCVDHAVRRPRRTVGSNPESMARDVRVSGGRRHVERLRR